MALPRPLRRLLSLVLLNCLTGTEVGALAGVIKFVLGAAAARDAPARIAARRTVRACVLQVSQVKLIVSDVLGGRLRGAGSRRENAGSVRGPSRHGRVHDGFNLSMAEKLSAM